MTKIDAEAHRVRPTRLLTIFAAFFRLGLTSFGGGTAGWLHDEMVQRRQWLDNPTFLSALALGQIMPGSNGVNMAVQIGQMLRRGIGALVGVVGLLSGPLAITMALSVGYAKLPRIEVVDTALDGAAAAAVGLIFATGLRIIWRASPSAASLSVTFATMLCIGVLRWPMLPVLTCLVPVSIGLALARRPT